MSDKKYLIHQAQTARDSSLCCALSIFRTYVFVAPSAHIVNKDSAIGSKEIDVMK